MIRKGIIALVAMSVVAIAPAAAQAKIKVVRIGDRCQYMRPPPASPAAICGIKGQEEIIGDAGWARLGFKVSKTVRVGMAITTGNIIDSAIYLEKRAKNGKTLLPTGKRVGSFIDPPGMGVCEPHRTPELLHVCRSEQFDLKPGSYVFTVRLQAASPAYVPFSLTMTAVPSGYVSPYVTGLDT